MNIVLIEPEIPQNAGNIVRTCAVTGTKLYMVKPLGFSLDEKHFKRAGMDYRDFASVEVVESFEDLLNRFKDKKFYYASTKSKKTYAEVNYEPDSFIVFGKESYGIKESILKENMETCIRIPMVDEARSLNLSNSVAIILYEALRQNNFKDLKFYGELTGRKEG